MATRSPRTMSLFTVQLYLDEKNHSPQRDLLVIVGGKPIEVEKLDTDTIRSELAHRMRRPSESLTGFGNSPAASPGKALPERRFFGHAWNLSVTPANSRARPIRLKEYVAGQRLVLERNPYYWKAGSKREPAAVPRMESFFLFVSNEDARLSGSKREIRTYWTRSARKISRCLGKQQASRHYHLDDFWSRPRIQFSLFQSQRPWPESFPEIAKKQAWFQGVRFRQAVSAAIDRDAIVRLVYNGRATPLWDAGHSRQQAVDRSAHSSPAKSVDHARDLLKSAGFSWKSDGTLVDSTGSLVEFSILTSSSNAQRVKMATLIQDDLSQLGMNVHVVSLEFHAMVDRLSIATTTKLPSWVWPAAMRTRLRR